MDYPLLMILKYYYVGASYAAEVTWMKNWITQRLAYLDIIQNGNTLFSGKIVKVD